MNSAGFICLRNRVPDNLRAAVGKREEKFSLKMLDPVEESDCTPPLWSPWKNVAAYRPRCLNLPSASLAVSTAITFAFLAQFLFV
jgi:hypothetical protein